ncbi:hypothetical protein [Streptomyces flavofungini]|uniref:Transcriptional regulator n=1 Tax=Streptomyces flavofungini TaxID=68200 RepID=A0ABS0XGG2_9ACTN|nr:hypothetical protein [Streptomyces flavofungini]MBJ3812321.1 hypothetical protein [Streptomyces flavofungini]GHC88461.1 hypothetical protein GCM10010349_75760 [Streptomyces flavofungini]
MTSRPAARLIDAAGIAAEHNMSSARVSDLYNHRDENGFPETADHRGRARLWDHAKVTKWFSKRPGSRLREHTPPTRDPQELLNAAEASRFLGYKNDNQVTTYVRDHPDYFPKPDVVEELGTPERPYRRLQWRVQTLLDWMATRPGSGQRSGVKRAAPPLPDVPVDGDLDELLSPTQAAALLGFKSLNSFSSSLSQGNLPLLKTPEPLKVDGRRRWTRRRILEQKDQRDRRS